jgi:hypothetical protein
MDMTATAELTNSMKQPYGLGLIFTAAAVLAGIATSAISVYGFDYFEAAWGRGMSFNMSSVISLAFGVMGGIAFTVMLVSLGPMRRTAGRPSLPTLAAISGAAAAEISGAIIESVTKVSIVSSVLVFPIVCGFAAWVFHRFYARPTSHGRERL